MKSQVILYRRRPQNGIKPYRRVTIDQTERDSARDRSERRRGRKNGFDVEDPAGPCHCIERRPESHPGIMDRVRKPRGHFGYRTMHNQSSSLAPARAFAPVPRERSRTPALCEFDVTVPQQSDDRIYVSFAGNNPTGRLRKSGSADSADQIAAISSKPATSSHRITQAFL